MRVLVLDNYDSFTYNLVQYLGELGAEPVVIRNDVMPPEDARELEADRLLISPGPGTPENAGYSVEYVATLGLEMPTLGVCLGHQAIAVAFGGKVDRAPEPRHGKTSQITHDDRGLFAGLSNPFTATRYHSLATVHLPDVLEASALQRGWRGPGSAPSRPPHHRRPVPSRVGDDHRRQGAPAELPRSAVGNVTLRPLRTASSTYSVLRTPY